MNRNTFFEIELSDDKRTIVRLTLSYGRLYKLRAADKKSYDRYNRVVINGVKEDLDNIEVLYAAYACAYIDEPHMTFEEFLEVAPYDRDVIGRAIEMLLTPSKKKQNSQKYFRSQQKR